MEQKRYSKEEIEEMIIQSAKEDNILPIISRCDANCIFCSHKNNPSDVRVVSVGTRSLNDIKKTLPYLNGDQVITIGESASNIIEGEPTLHPEFEEIMKAIRQAHPHAPISITTNGRYLTEELVSYLHKIGNMRINFSINSATVDGRHRLMNDTIEQADTAIHSVDLMKKYQISFTASMVGMPNITGYDDIRHTISYLAEHGASSISIFMPGFSSYVKEDIFPDPDNIYNELKDFIDHLSTEIPCPVLLEPSYVSDLTPVVSGVLHYSPAWNAGIRRGDIILSVNGQVPRSRVEAWNLLEGSGTKNVQLKSGKKQRHLTFKNLENGLSGVTMEYDFDMRQAEYLQNVIMTAPGKVLALCSEFAYPLLCSVYEFLGFPKECYTIKLVKNHTFGGTIRAAGLLTNKDFVAAYDEYCNEFGAPDAILMPAIAYNYLGKDLCGHHFNEFKDYVKKPIVLM